VVANPYVAEETGYQDWVRPDKRIGVPIVGERDVPVVAAQDTYGSFYVGNWNGVRIHAEGDNAHLKVEMHFGYDGVADASLGRWHWSLRTGKHLLDVVPIMGNWMAVHVLPTAAGADPTYSIWVTPVAETTPRARGQIDQTLILWNAQNVGAGATVTLQATQAANGEAYLHCYSVSPAWDISVLTVPSSGSRYRMFKRVGLGAASDVIVPVYLVGGHAEVDLINNDVAARAFDGVLALSGWGG
jgi:hypothetical protein